MHQQIPLSMKLKMIFIRCFANRKTQIHDIEFRWFSRNDSITHFATATVDSLLKTSRLKGRVQRMWIYNLSTFVTA